MEEFSLCNWESSELRLEALGRSNSENSESIDGAIHDYRGKTRFSTEGLEEVGAVMGEAIS